MFKALTAIILSAIISVVANIHLSGEMNARQEENEEDVTLSLVSINILQDSVLGLEKEVKLLKKELEIQKKTDELFFSVMKEGFETVADKLAGIELQNRLKDTPFKPGELLPGFPPPALPDEPLESKDLRIN